VELLFLPVPSRGKIAGVPGLCRYIKEKRTEWEKSGPNSLVSAKRKNVPMNRGEGNLFLAW
jgi:hypothetical protein